MLFILLLSFIPIITSKNPFEDAKFMKEENDINKLMELLKNKEPSLILIYSPYCPHCHSFSTHYKKLAEKFHDEVHFYLMNGVENSSYGKKFDIRGYPSLWIFDGENYQELKNGYNYDYIANIITSTLIKDICHFMSFKNISLNYNLFFNRNNDNDEKIPNKTVIAFIKKEDEKLLSFVKNVINKNKKLMDKCVICSDFIEEKGIDLEYLNRRIYSLSNQKGVSTFVNLKYYLGNKENKKEEVFERELNSFLKSNLRMFIDISHKNIPFPDEFQSENTLIFSYETEEEREQYLEYIQYLSLFNKNQNLDLDYMLYNFKSEHPTIRKKKYGISAGIFLSDKTMNSVSIVSDLHKIEEMIVMSNNIDLNFNGNFNFNLPHSDEKSNNLQAVRDELNKIYQEGAIEDKPSLTPTWVLVGFIFLVIYTILFYFIFYLIYNKKYLLLLKEIKNNQIKMNGISEKEIQKNNYVEAKSEENVEMREVQMQ